MTSLIIIIALVGLIGCVTSMRASAIRRYGKLLDMLAELRALPEEPKGGMYLVVKEWYDTGHRTHETWSLSDRKDIGDMLMREDGANREYAIVNVIRLR